MERQLECGYCSRNHKTSEHKNWLEALKQKSVEEQKEQIKNDNILV